MTKGLLCFLRTLPHPLSLSYEMYTASHIERDALHSTGFEVGLCYQQNVLVEVAA